VWNRRAVALGDHLSEVERVERVPLAPGVDGTHQTIDVMSKAAMGSFGAGSGRIRNLAVQIVRDAGVPERDKRGETIAVHEWVKKHLRYVKDPLWYEFVTYPETLAFERNDGDCDDHVVLEAALLGALGIPTRFVVYAFKNAAQFAHVAMHANVDNKWMPLDPIVKNQPAGWEVPDATTRHVYGVNTPDGPQKTGRNVGEWIALGVGIVALWKMIAAMLKKAEHRL
jgi:hypothetical protein